MLTSFRREKRERMYKRLPTREKIKLIKRVQTGEPITKVCREAGVSRTIFYQWQKKYELAAPRAKKKILTSRVREGKKHWKILPSKIERKILKTSLENPSFSPQKISQITGISPHGVWNVLKRKRLNTQQDRKAYLYKYGPTLIKPPTFEDKITMIRRYKAGEPIAYLCIEFGISRTTFYKWLKRYELAPEEERREVLSSWRPKEEKHWRFVPGAKKLVLEIIVEQPELSAQKIVQKLPLKEGKPILGSHGIYNLLKKLNLNIYEKRLAYAQAQAPVITPTYRLPVILRKLIGKIPVISAIPPPSRQFFASVFPPFFLSFLSSIGFSILFIYWLNILAQAPTPGQKVGLIFATMALTIGSFFFAYSMKYYLTLAIVLSFSREVGAEGLPAGRQGIGVGLTGPTSSRQGGASRGKSNGWLSRIFDPPAGGGNGPDVTSGLNGRNGLVRGGGLQPSLDHIKLERYPFVSIHLPFYNERKVAERILRACTSMDYPGNNYEIIVCDDSTDETTAIVQRFAEQYNKQQTTNNKQPIIKVLHRPTRQGFKGGALSYALKEMSPQTEFVVVFDADFIPYPDTLELFVKYFQANGLDFAKHKFTPEVSRRCNTTSGVVGPEPNIAVVGGYQWHVLNKSENWITRGVRTEYAGSYVIERPGREILGLLKQISGAVYMIRADVLKKIGWGTSITEDFQLTLKLYEQGYKVIYTPYVQAPAECVSTLKRLIRQRMRWAEGHSNNVRRMFVRLMLGRWEEVPTSNSRKGKFLISNCEATSSAYCAASSSAYYSNYSKQSPPKNLLSKLTGQANPKHQEIRSWNIGNSLGQLGIRSIRNSFSDFKNQKKVWVPSPLTLMEKLEFLYLSPYYLQAAFFVLGTFSWLISETVFRARLPFWTSVWGWSLVLTNFFSLPLVNAVGLFLEESEEKDYLGLLSFVALSYILVPFQAYASVKGFLERQEGPWFRTPKTGKITDILVRGRFYRWIAGILPGRMRAPALGGITASRLAPAPVSSGGLGRSFGLAQDKLGRLGENPYVALATANNRFNNFKVVKKQWRGLTAGVLIFLLVCTSVLIKFLPTVPFDQFPQAQAQVTISNESNYQPTQKTAEEEKKLRAEEHNLRTHPQDFFIDLEKMAVIEAGGELEEGEEGREIEIKKKEIKEKMKGKIKTLKPQTKDLAVNKEREFLPYYYRETNDGYQLFLRSEKGIQRYTFEKNSLSFWLAERDNLKPGFIDKAVSRPIFQYQDAQGIWREYIELIPLGFKLEKLDDYLLLIASVTLFAPEAASMKVPGEIEFKLGFDPSTSSGQVGGYTNKLTFRLKENENLNRLTWETKLMDEGVIKEDRTEVIDEYSWTVDREKIPVKEQRLGEVVINWQDFAGETRCEQAKEENTNRVYFYEEGEKGTLAVDPTIATTVAASTITVSVSSEFEIRFDQADLGIDTWYDLENDSSKSTNLVNWEFLFLDELLSERIKPVAVGAFVSSAINPSSTSIELLENSPSRVVIRMKGTSTGTYFSWDRRFTVYPSGLIVLKTTLTSVSGHDIDIWFLVSSLHDAGDPAGDWNMRRDNDPVPPASNGEAVTTSDRWLAQYLAGVGSVLMLEQDWQRQETITVDTANGSILGFGYGQFTNITMDAGETIDYTTVAWIRPDTLDDEATNDGYKNDYLNPDDLADNLAVGSGWFDTEENTSSPSDFFNQDEGIYCLEAEMLATAAAEFDLDGGIYTHYQPNFKIRGWRQYNEPSAVKLEGSTLTDGTDYNLDLAPFSESWVYDNGNTWKKLAEGGDNTDGDEYLNDSTNDFDFDQAGYDIFDNVGDYFYLGSHDQFTGVNLDLDTAGTGSPTLTWQYCSVNADTTTTCDTWSTLTVTDTDSGASSMTASGNFYFSDPGGWVASTEGSPVGREALWWIRAYRSAGSYTDFPIENTIRTNIILLQYLANISSNDQTFLVVPENLWAFLVIIPLVTRFLGRRKRKKAK